MGRAAGRWSGVRPAGTGKPSHNQLSSSGGASLIHRQQLSQIPDGPESQILPNPKPNSTTLPNPKSRTPICPGTRLAVRAAQEAAMADDRDPNAPNVDDEVGKAANEDVTAPSNDD